MVFPGARAYAGAVVSGVLRAGVFPLGACERPTRGPSFIPRAAQFAELMPDMQQISVLSGFPGNWMTRFISHFK